MVIEPEQQDLFDWKPKEKKSLWLWKILKSKYFLIICSIIVGTTASWIFLRIIIPADFTSANTLILWGVIVTGLTFLALWLIPNWQIITLKNAKPRPEQSEFDLEKERIKLRDDTRKTMAQIIGGAFFVLGLFVTYNTFELNRQGHELSREGQVTERFSKAVELIGSENLSVRLGGLYALERIAKDSPKDHSTIMEILAAFIREKSKEKKEQLEKDKIINGKEKQNNKDILEGQFIDNKLIPPTDIFAAINIINRRNLENDKEDFVFNLRNSNLYNASLVDAHLDKADFRDSELSYADLRSANLKNTIFIDANLVGADLDGANLVDAHFGGANLTGVRFLSADLSSVTFINANLSGADFRNATLKDASFEGANLTDAFFSDAKLVYTNFRGLDLSSIKGLNFEQISNAIIDKTTKLPKELEPRRTELLKLSDINLETSIRIFNQR